EQADMTAICKELAQAGHSVRVVSPKKQAARSWDNTRWNGDMPVDVAAVEAEARDFDALVLPGGLLSADTLRSDDFIIRLARDAAAQGKPVAALGHAPWVLVEAGLVKGRAVTSHPAIRTDLANAGGQWRDEAFVADDGVITGRHSHDAVAFVSGLLQALR
ncbi:MAG TPA: DJ-1/PfpI family protein, partial [Candidatus Omnitrophota bacterium]|nr:DJ-1/PfpI family protein [Candidatus Omnitrophota bacterium]